jgi:hypothetical protein
MYRKKQADIVATVENRFTKNAGEFKVTCMGRTTKNEATKAK